MNYYQHRFNNVEEYLHHRSPYLMVDSVERIDEKLVETSKTIDASMDILHGHFPGAPVFPGAMMQEFLTQSAGVLIAANFNPMESFNTSDPLHNQYALGVLVKVENARYKSFARPGDILKGKVRLLDVVSTLFRFEGFLEIENEEIMRINFTLANIESDVLVGS